MYAIMTDTEAFQSTPSVWRETDCETLSCADCWNISIHSLRVEGDAGGESIVATCVISIHSLRVEGDNPSDQRRIFATIFQSTPSVWRETRQNA